jgi:hypothetical protein
MSSVPDDIATLVRDAAKAVPGAYGNTEAVVRRARQYRRRRAAAVATGAGVLVILSAVTVPVLAGRGAERVVPPAVVATTSAKAVTGPAAQRLLLAKTGEIAVEKGLPELRPDGSVDYRSVPKGTGDVVALPDGRLVALVTTDLQPGVKRADGPGVEGVSVKLVVLNARGGVEREREVRKKGEELRLLGATEKTAYLRRATGVVAHELATGLERRVLPPAMLQESASTLFPTTDLAADRLVVADGDGNRGCTVRVADLPTGDQLPVRRVSTGTCMADHVRLSPDGRLAAVAYLRLSAVERRVAVLDLESGKVLADQPLGTRPVKNADEVNAAGVAWSDDRTVRVAVTELPPGADRVYRLSEVLRTVTVTL